MLLYCSCTLAHGSRSIFLAQRQQPEWFISLSLTNDKEADQSQGIIIVDRDDAQGMGGGHKHV